MAPNAAEMPGGGAKQAYSDREPSSSLRLHRRERGIREQLEPMPSRHEVIESFRQEALLQRGRYTFAKRNALHRQRMQSRQLAHEFSSERPALKPGESQVSRLESPGRENLYLVQPERCPDRRGKLRPSPGHSVHANARPPDAGVLISQRHTQEKSVGLVARSPLSNNKSEGVTEGEAEKAIRIYESDHGASMARRNLWSRLQCTSHATKEKLPRITVTRNDDGLEAVNVILHPTYLAQLAPGRERSSKNQIPTKPAAGLTAMVRNHSRPGSSAVGTHPLSVEGVDLSNLATVIAMTKILEQKLTDLRHPSNSDLTPFEVEYLVSALSKLRTDALLIQERKIAVSASRPDGSQCDSNDIMSLTSWQTNHTVGDTDWLDLVTLKLFGSLEVAEMGLDKFTRCSP